MTGSDRKDRSWPSLTVMARPIAIIDATAASIFCS
jgi:hypothetical protein